MDPNALTQYLYEHIPLSQAMGITVVQADLSKTKLAAPLMPNINHKKTVFGGSLHAVATTACWCLAYLHVREIEGHYEVVISSSHINYLHPVTEDFSAECQQNEKKSFEQFKNRLQRKGIARIQLNANIIQGGQCAVAYSGEFVAIKLP